MFALRRKRWKMVKLSKIITQVRGVSYKPNDVILEKKAGYTCLLRANNIDRGELKFDDVVYVDSARVKNIQLLRAGDILICASSGSRHLVGKAACVTGDMNVTFGAFCKVIRPSAEYASFLGWFFKSPRYRMQISNASAGVNINNIRAEDIDNMEIDLRTVKQREEAVRKLNAVTRLISLRQRQAEKLDELVKARFVEMFGDLAAPNCKWETIKIVEACENENDIKCGPFGTQLSKNEYQETGVAVWEIPQINSGFQMVPTHFLTAEKAEALRDYSIVPGDIAMSRKGNVGKCAVFPESLEAGIIHSDVLRIRVNHETVSAIFLMYQLHFSEAVKHQIAIVSSGAIMAGINVTKLKKIRIHIPPLALQTEFAHFVHEVDREKERIQRSAALLETLKRSLMQQYFG